MGCLSRLVQVTGNLVHGATHFALQLSVRCNHVRNLYGPLVEHDGRAHDNRPTVMAISSSNSENPFCDRCLRMLAPYCCCELEM